MVMRLLSKSDIDKQKNQEAGQTIAEGKKLATAVDRLRELRADEEATLGKFRSETIAGIQKEIEPLAKERDDLKSEVATLKEQKTEAQKPLDAEWERVQQDKQGILELQVALSDRREHLEKREEAVVSREVILRASLETALADKAQAQKEREEATQTLSSAKDSAQTMREDAEIVLKNAHRKEQDVLERELHAKNREDHVATRETNAQVKEKENLDKELELQSRWASLERTIKKLGIKI